MKHNKETRSLMLAYKNDITLPRLIILKLLKRDSLYVSQIAELIDLDVGSTLKFIKRLKKMSLVVTSTVRVAPGHRGKPTKTLVEITTTGNSLMDSIGRGE